MPRLLSINYTLMPEARLSYRFNALVLISES